MHSYIRSTSLFLLQMNRINFSRRLFTNLHADASAVMLCEDLFLQVIVLYLIDILDKFKVKQYCRTSIMTCFQSLLRFQTLLK